MKCSALLPLALSFAVATSFVFAAQEPEVRPSDERPTLATIAWMTGHWRQTGERTTTEELWMPASGGLVLGLNRSVQRRGERPPRASFEFLRIEERESGVVYVAQPSGGSAVEFALTAADGDSVVFENPEHDFPRRIEYRLEDGELVARATVDGRGPTWRFARVGEVH